MSHSLSTTDVTRAQIPNRPEMPAYPRNSPTEDKKMYYAVKKKYMMIFRGEFFSFLFLNTMYFKRGKNYLFFSGIGWPSTFEKRNTIRQTKFRSGTTNASFSTLGYLLGTSRYSIKIREIDSLKFHEFFRPRSFFNVFWPTTILSFIYIYFLNRLWSSSRGKRSTKRKFDENFTLSQRKKS